MADVGLIGGLAQGLQNGLDAYQGQRKYNLEKQNQQAGLLAKGMMVDDNGNVTQGPLAQQQQDYERQNFDPSSMVSQHKKNLARTILRSSNPNLKDEEIQSAIPEDIAGHEIDKSGLLESGIKGGYGYMGQQARGAATQGLMDVRREQMDQGIHQKVVDSLKKDTPSLQRLNQYQNLSNTMNNLMNASHLTPQQLDEAQQSIRSNLGIKGSSGVGEREKTFINSLGLNSERLQQFLTGNPADISRDNQLLKHIEDLAKLEQQNIQKQMDKRINVVTGGRSSFYNKRPDLKQDLNELVSNVKQQYQPDTTQSSGSINGSGPVQLNPEDMQALQWANGNPNDPRAAAIKQRLGAK